MPKQQTRFINWTGAPANHVQRRHSGAPKVPWTPKRLRQIMWLYLLTPLSTEKIARIVEEAEENRSIFHPQYERPHYALETTSTLFRSSANLVIRASSIRQQLRELLGTDYVNYHVKSQASAQGMNELLSLRLKVRVRSIKNGEHTLAKYLKLAKSAETERRLATINKPDHDFLEGAGDESEIFYRRFVEEPTDNDYDDESRGQDSTESEVVDGANVATGQETEQLLCRLKDRVAMRERFSWSSLTSSALSLALSVKRLSHSTCRTSLKLSSKYSSLDIANEGLQGSQSSSDQSQHRDIRTMLMKLYPSMSASTLSKEAHNTLEDLIDIHAVSSDFYRADGLTLRRSCCNVNKHCERFLHKNISWNGYSDRDFHAVPSSAALDQILCRQCQIRGSHIFAFGGVSVTSPQLFRDLCVADRYGNSVLHYAAAQSTVRYRNDIGLIGLVKQGASDSLINLVNRQGQTFLHNINPFVFGAEGSLWDNIATLAQHIKLIDPNFDFDRQDCHGQTFWHCICTALHGRGLLYSFYVMNPTSFFNALYHTSTNIRRKDNKGCSIVQYFPDYFPTQGIHSDPWNLFWGGMTDIVASIDNFSKEDLQRFDMSGDTILLSFVKSSAPGWKTLPNSSKEVLVKTLIDRGVPIEARDRAGESALFIAARTGQPCVVRALLNYGAGYSILNYNDQSLFAAAREAILKIRQLDTFSSVKKEADVLACMITLLDHQWGNPLSYFHQYAE